MREEITLSAEISKVDVDRRLVYGWASVIEEKGEPVTDSHDDQISLDELQAAAHDFIDNARVGKLMHRGRQVARIVESVVFSTDVQKALGIDLEKVGWFIAMKIEDEDVWKQVKAGELKAFSIGGLAAREEIKEVADAA